MAVKAGQLRHRVTIQSRTDQQDPTYGGITPKWKALHSNVWARIKPIAAREFIAGDAKQSLVIANITIRYKSDVTAANRIVHGTRIYNIEGVLTDDDSGLEYLTLPCSEGVNEG